MRVEELQVVYEAIQRRDWSEVITFAKEAQEKENNGDEIYSTPEERVRRFEQASKEFG